MCLMISVSILLSTNERLRSSTWSTLGTTDHFHTLTTMYCQTTQQASREPHSSLPTYSVSTPHESLFLPTHPHLHPHPYPITTAPPQPFPRSTNPSTDPTPSATRAPSLSTPPFSLNPPMSSCGFHCSGSSHHHPTQDGYCGACFPGNGGCCEKKAGVGVKCGWVGLPG